MSERATPHRGQRLYTFVVDSGVQTEIHDASKPSGRPRPQGQHVEPQGQDAAHPQVQPDGQRSPTPSEPSSPSRRRRPHRAVRELRDEPWPSATASPPAPAGASRASPTSPRSPRARPRRRCSPAARTGGRNSEGHKTARHKGGGHKRQYRLVDFKRTKDGVGAKVAAIEYDPNRTCRIALLHYEDGEKAYILAPRNVKVGDRLMSGRARHPPRTAPVRYIPVGTVVHNVELRPGQGGKMARSAGSSVQLVAKEGDFASLRLPSTRDAPRAHRLPGHRGRGRQRRARAHQDRQGRPQPLKGVRPQTRGVAMNPVDHPHGGGEGKTSGGRSPVSPAGKPEGRTRNKKKPSQQLIIRRRRTGKGRR